MFEKKLTQSVQRDYLEAAEQHRLLKENSHNPQYAKAIMTAGLALTTFVLVFMGMSHLLGL